MAGNYKTARDWKCTVCATTFQSRQKSDYCSGKCKEQSARDTKGYWYTKKHNLKKYGLTIEDYHFMLEAQAYSCGSCGTTEPGGKGWHIDHDHTCCPESARSCGKCIRGILCHSCNISLGALNEDVEKILALAEYVQRGGAI